MKRLYFDMTHVAPPKTVQTCMDSNRLERELGKGEREFPGRDVIVRPSLCIRSCAAFLQSSDEALT